MGKTCPPCTHNCAQGRGCPAPAAHVQPFSISDVLRKVFKVVPMQPQRPSA